MATWLIEDGGGLGWACACAVATRQEQPWHSTGWTRAVARAQGMSILIWEGAEGWFWLMMAGALYNGAEVLGTHSASGAKQHSPSPSILRLVLQPLN